MTRKERTALRDRARKDFEGKTYENTFIFEASISIFDSGEVHIILYDEYMEGFCNFNVCKYDEVLSRCEKNFPKDGFSIALSYKHPDEMAYQLCLAVSKHYKCRWNCVVDRDLPEVTLEELKKEAIRIIKTI